MTRDDIIKLAGDCDLGRVCGPLDTLLDYEWEKLQRFANLVAAAELEACEMAVEDIARKYQKLHHASLENIADECAAAIRARIDK